MDRRALRLLPWLLALAWAMPAAAQPQDDEELALIYGDKTTVKIATGNQQDLRRAPAVATVITAEDIAAMGATDLDEVLETVPGLHVARNNVTYAPLYAIRGVVSANTPQTLLLQNGIPMTTSFLGTKGGVWAGFPVENIARIEVIRGPGSALYGADAYAGVINIITKTAADVAGTEFGLRAGAFNSRDAWTLHGGKAGAVDVAAFLRLGRTDGSRETVTADAQSRFDRQFGTAASLAPSSVNNGHDAVDGGLDLGYDKWRLRVGYKLRDDVGTGAGIAQALDPIGKAKSERITADLSWNDAQISRYWGGGVTAAYLEYNDTVPVPFALYPAGARLAGAFPQGVIGAPEKWERQMRLSALATYSGFAGHGLRFGIGHDDLNLYRTHAQKNYNLTGAGLPTPLGAMVESTESTTFLTPHRRKVDYVYAQDEWNFARDWTLTAGVRTDRYSDAGSTTNPRLAVVWDAALDLTAKLLYGSAFRPPAFVEQYSINNPVTRGNPSLKPETNKTLETAFSWQARKDTQINLNFFRYRMQDIIRIVSGTYSNAGDQHGSGMELEAVWDASRAVRLTGSYSHQRSVDGATGQDAGYAPHHHLYGRADWRFTTSWLASTQLNYIGDRRRAPGDTRPVIADYTTVDLTVRSDRGKNRWDVAASVRNLFNAKVLEPSVAPGLAIPDDLPMPRRGYYIQVSHRL